MTDSLAQVSRDAQAVSRRMCQYVARFNAADDEDFDFVGLKALLDQMRAVQQRYHRFPINVGYGIDDIGEAFHRGESLAYLTACVDAHAAIQTALEEYQERLRDELDGGTGLGQSSGL